MPESKSHSESEDGPPIKGERIEQVNTGREIKDLCWLDGDNLLAATWTEGLQQITPAKPGNKTRKLGNQKYYRVASGDPGFWAAVCTDFVRISRPGKEGKTEVENWRPPQVKKPGAVCYYEDELYVSEDRSSRVEVYDAMTKAWKKSLTLEMGSRLVHMTLSPAGKLLATTTGHKLLIYDLEKNDLVSVGGKGSGKGEFNQPRGVATDNQGNILVCDHYNQRISVLDRDGKFLHQLEVELGGAYFPTSIAVFEYEVDEDEEEEEEEAPLMAVGGYGGYVNIYELSYPVIAESKPSK